MAVREQALEVPAELGEWISDLDVATVEDRAPGHPVVDEPDHATRLVLRVAPGRGGELVVVGPRTRASYHVSQPGLWCARATLRPGRAARLLGCPAGQLVDRILPLGVFRPPVSPAESFAHLLTHALPTATTPRETLLRDAVTLLSTGTEGVAGVARRLGVSERHLRTVFADDVGLSPKHFARIERLRTVLADSPRRPLAELAATLGFSDQSHLSGEFRRFMGVSPAAFRRGELPPATGCSARSVTVAPAGDPVRR
ncbi:AraC family transcriptional regulator [Actinophytocola xanthii]|uniref:HTH araC/xylS-type domain-containing protein n=1 Tax=Actinophytocola xanthii TaxID=1912961 RepID=A0A1Q8CV01_9PSEU|nr:AraC family transcriptional regulator [Actinophytocola xanthii]OLF18183.1 hypothetical protein BU204_07545 [Actinophytocola xanthii]